MAASINRTFILRNEAIAEAACTFIRANAVAMAKAGTPLAVAISEATARRNHAQNARLHALMTDIAQNAWVDGRQFGADTWKEHMRRKFIGVEELTLPDGEVIERGLSTVDLGVAAFSDFITKIEEYATRVLGVELPNL